VQRLGGRTAKKIDFRLITATNEDLEDCVRKGRFREDRYFSRAVGFSWTPNCDENESEITRRCV